MREYVVSCTKIPDNKHYLCFRSDYKVFSLKNFKTGLLKPPNPPMNICRLPGVFNTIRDPEEFMARVNVPCRITTPCVIYRGVDGVEVPESRVDTERCEKCLAMRGEGEYCEPAWDALTLLMNYAKTLPYYGRETLWSTVFIERKKAYVAPWGPTRFFYIIIRTLIELGFLSEKFEVDATRKHNALDMDDVIGEERCGTIKDMAFNYYRYRRKYRAVAIFWTRSDRDALKYAMKQWDLYRDVTKPVMNTLAKLTNQERLRVEMEVSMKLSPYPHTLGLIKYTGGNKDIKTIIRKAVVGEQNIKIDTTPIEKALNNLFSQLVTLLVSENATAHSNTSTK